MRLRTITLPLLAVAAMVILFAVPASASPSAVSVQRQLNAQGENVEGSLYSKLFMYSTVTYVEIKTESKIAGVDVFLSEFVDKPQGVGNPPTDTLIYIEITTNVDKENIETATIRFRLSKSWAEQNGVNVQTVKLLRLNGEWTELPTRLVHTTDYSLYYEATTPGFSLFAVAGEKAPVSAASPLLLIALASMFAAVAGGGAFYYFWTRPMKQLIPLKKLMGVMDHRREPSEISKAEPAEVLKMLTRATGIKHVHEPTALVRPVRFKPAGQRAKRDLELLKELNRKVQSKK